MADVSQQVKPISWSSFGEFNCAPYNVVDASNLASDDS